MENNFLFASGFEVSDTLTTADQQGGGPYPLITEPEHTIYVATKAFELQLLPGMQTRKKAEAQMLLDFPRMRVYDAHRRQCRYRHTSSSRKTTFATSRRVSWRCPRDPGQKRHLLLRKGDLRNLNDDRGHHSDQGSVRLEWVRRNQMTIRRRQESRLSLCRSRAAIFAALEK